MSDGYCTLWFNSSSTEIHCVDGLTIEQAFRTAADELGLDINSPLTYSVEDQVVPGSNVVVPGVEYTASSKKDTKGN